MRRWLTLVLLFVLPIQFAWSAAAAYCQHEQAPGTAHIGHHSHEHKADKGSSDSADQHGSKAAKSGKLVADNDCGYCHLSFAKSMMPLALQFDTDAAFTLDTSPSPTFRSRGPDHRDRPNWRIA